MSIKTLDVLSLQGSFSSPFSSSISYTSPAIVDLPNFISFKELLNIFQVTVGSPNCQNSSESARPHGSIFHKKLQVSDVYHFKPTYTWAFKKNKAKVQLIQWHISCDIVEQKKVWSVFKPTWPQVVSLSTRDEKRQISYIIYHRLIGRFFRIISTEPMFSEKLILNIGAIFDIWSSIFKSRYSV